MCTHIPGCGHCLLVYGPHVGIDQSGVAGSLNRRGMAEPGPCCGSAAAAAAAAASAVTEQENAGRKRTRRPTGDCDELVAAVRRSMGGSHRSHVGTSSRYF